jgi:hypothetical protein
MSSFARLFLLIGMLLAASASIAAARTHPWLVVARSHKTPSMNGQPVIHVRMPVAVVAGRRRPEALAVRLVVRRQSRYARGWFGYMITCGGWRHVARTAMQVATPLILPIPFRMSRAHFCTIDTGGSGLNGSDDVTLDVLCRARSRSSCAPIKPD